MDDDFKVDVSKNVVGGDTPQSCQTHNAKWLCITNAYEKLHRPNFYDIGQTYTDDVLDYRFTFKTEQVGSIFLLHLFVSNHQENSFSINLSQNNELIFDRKNEAAYLPSFLPTFKEQTFKKFALKSQIYLTTYSFYDLFIDSLKDKKLYIAFSFPSPTMLTINKKYIDHVKVKHDFGDLLKDPVGSDFVIESADGEKFHVHKVLLAAQSEVFKAMLKDDTAESQNNYVKLIDVGKEDLNCILEFIYTGTVPSLDKYNCSNLLILADRYNLSGLRKLTQYALSQQLHPGNALEILSVADMSNSEALKTATLKFIKKNVSVLSKTMFKEMNNAELVRELCKYLALSTTE